MRSSRAGVALALLALAGCGGARHQDRSERGVAEGAPGEHDRDRGAVRGVAPADQVAYYQLATATGFLCASAGTAREGGASRDRAGEQLAAAAGRLGAVHPSDASLRSALAVLSVDLTRWRDARNHGARRHLAPTVLADCRRLQGSLSTFLNRRRRSGLSGSIPD